MARSRMFGGSLVLVTLLIPACAATPGDELGRRGDEIMVAGRLFHTGAPVVLWTDPGGYDAYRVEKRFVPFEQAAWDAGGGKDQTPNRFGLRFGASAAEAFSPEQLEQVRGGGWSLELLREKVDQFVIHYDVCGTSRTCFRVLHDARHLSVHFMLDLDGTIYQTLDVKERAWHATTSNDRSVGIEIANIGAYGPGEKDPFDRWYQREPAPGPAGTVGATRVRITIPPGLGDGGVRTPGFVGRPARPEMVVGDIHGRPLRQYDLTPEQYDSLIRLTAALCRVLPRVRCDYPRDAEGRLVRGRLPDDQLASYTGLLGHYHIQANKVDPGPAFDWDRVVNGARRLLPATGRR